MRTILVILLALHGLIHFIGTVSAHKLGDDFTGRTLFVLPAAAQPFVKVAWATAALLFIAGAVLVYLRAPLWWAAAAAGVALSQLLVIYAWPDAKFGTFANILLVLPIAFGWADARFDRESHAQMEQLLTSLPIEAAAPVQEADLAALPPPVQRWLRGSGVVGKPRVRSVWLEQTAELRTAPDQDFMPTAAYQLFTTDPPGFVWRARVRMMKVLPVAGRDSYKNGRGHMLIRAGALITMVDAAGPEIDQGTMLRWLGELVWFPSAALSPLITWDADGTEAASATMTWQNTSVTARFHFDSAGRMTRMEAERFMGDGSEATLRPWVVTATDWGNPAGALIPIRGEVAWQLPEGLFTYYRWSLGRVVYDPAKHTLPSH